MGRSGVFYKILGQFWIVVPCTIFVISYGIYNREFPGLDPANATLSGRIIDHSELYTGSQDVCTVGTPPLRRIRNACIQQKVYL